MCPSGQGQTEVIEGVYRQVLAALMEGRAAAASFSTAVVRYTCIYACVPVIVCLSVCVRERVTLWVQLGTCIQVCVWRVEQCAVPCTTITTTAQPPNVFLPAQPCSREGRRQNSMTQAVVKLGAEKAANTRTHTTCVCCLAAALCVPPPLLLEMGELSWPFSPCVRGDLGEISLFLSAFITMAPHL